MIEVVDGEAMADEAMRIGTAVVDVIKSEVVGPTVVALCNLLEVLGEAHPSHRQAIANQLRRSAGRLAGAPVAPTKDKE